jgi:hypothetical protein
MTDLFCSFVLQVAKHFELEYPDEEYQRVLTYLKQVRTLTESGNEGL